MRNTRKVKIQTTLFQSLFVLFTVTAAARAGGPNHLPRASMPAVPSPQERMAYLLIGEASKTEIQPVFERRCLACHASPALFPTYYKVPAIKQKIDEDREEARLQPKLKDWMHVPLIVFQINQPVGVHDKVRP